MEGRNSIRQVPVSVVLAKNEQDPMTIEEPFSNNHRVPNDDSESIRFRIKRYAYTAFKWHVKQCPNNRTLKVFRGISIILFLSVSITDTVAYAAPSNPPSVALQFIWGAKYPLYEIATGIYCSGAYVFGVSFEIYPFILLAILNVILQSRNCGDVQFAVIFLIRTICLIVAVELAYRNFRRLSYDFKPRKKSSRVMLHQSLLFALSILYFASKGLRIVYDGAINKCEFDHFVCGLIDFDVPAFEAHSPCDPSFIEYVSSREEIRILRDWLILNIAFYATFNRALLDLGTLKHVRTWWFLPRFIVLILFLALATSFLVVNISPFQVHNTKTVFDIIELVLFVYGVSLMIYKLIWSRPGATIDGNNEHLQEDPHILPQL